MAETSPYYFLLKTENFRPLIDLVDDVSAKLRENQDAIERLTDHVDSDLSFPSFPTDIIDTTSIQHDNKDNSTDTLKYFLNQKYKLDEIPLKASKTNLSSNPRIDELLNDIQRLNLIKQANNEKIREMSFVIKDYESFMAEMVMPNLRNDIHRYREFLKANMEQIQLRKKLNSTSHLWSKYVEYLENLHKLSSVCEKLFAVSNFDLDNEGVCLLKKKLLFIDELTNRLKVIQI